MPLNVFLDTSSISIPEGETKLIYATVMPENAANKTVVWKSSNQKIATVSNGYITAVKEGTATITAETVNGKTATCFVTVVKNSIAFNTLQTEGLTAYGKVSNETSVFSFIDEIKVTGNVSFTVSNDLGGKDVIP
ncbi:MAG: Ig domain-containing protein, partial [Clostridia bacterium]|nr:Ig domain-containing protein [Clostridia bacterium]